MILGLALMIGSFWIVGKFLGWLFVSPFVDMSKALNKDEKEYQDFVKMKKFEERYNNEKLGIKEEIEPPKDSKLGAWLQKRSAFTSYEEYENNI